MKTFEYYKNGTIHGTIEAENKQDAKNKLFAQTGKEYQVEETEELDLFETPENLPIEIQEIIQTYVEEENTYTNCANMLNQVKQYGYEFDYGLDASPFDLKLMKSTKLFRLTNNAWDQIENEEYPQTKQIILYNDDLTFKGVGIY